MSADHRCTCNSCHHDAEHIPLPEILAECDAFFNSGNSSAVGETLRRWRSRARECGDTAGELTLLSELMGHYRMAGDALRGMAAVKDGFALIRQLGISGTVSAGTIFINGATALHSFGQTGAALEAFAEAEKCYTASLTANDRKFAGLFNNMAAVYAETSDFDRAEKYYLRAMDILSSPADLMDYAVTCVNLAQLYHRRDPEDPETGAMLDAAMLCFDHPGAVKDGYYAHTCSKCAAAFGELGRPGDEKDLNARAEAVYAGN